MRVFLDIDLVFEIRYLILNLARKHQNSPSSHLPSLYYQSLHQNLEFLSYMIPDSQLINFLRTVRFKIDGFSLFSQYNSQNLTFISEIEPNYYSTILSANNLDPIPQVSFKDLNEQIKHESGAVKVIISHMAKAEELRNQGVDVKYIPLTGPIDLDYKERNLPWNEKFELEDKICVEGKITTGFGRGSKELGFPTANVDFALDLELIPGIYAGKVVMDERNYKAAISIGYNPVFNNAKKSFEVYILSRFDESLVGKNIKCQLCFYLRCEANFRSLEDLIWAITADVRLTEELIVLA
jgi:riboflavin kinase